MAAGRCGRPSIGNDPGLVNHLVEDHDIGRGLKNPRGAVVDVRKRRAEHASSDAPIVGIEVLGSGRLTGRLPPTTCPARAVFGQLRQTSVGGIDDQRRLHRRPASLGAGPPSRPTRAFVTGGPGPHKGFPIDLAESVDPRPRARRTPARSASRGCRDPPGARTARCSSVRSSRYPADRDDPMGCGTAMPPCAVSVNRTLRLRHRRRG